MYLNVIFIVSAYYLHSFAQYLKKKKKRLATEKDRYRGIYRYKRYRCTEISQYIAKIFCY